MFIQLIIKGEFLSMGYIQDLERKDELAPKVVKYVLDYGNESLSFKHLADEFEVSDILIYEILYDYEQENGENLTQHVSSRKKVDLKWSIVRFVIEEPYLNDMNDMLRLFEGTNHNQIIKYLEEENVREYVPTKYGKIEHFVISFLEKHPEEYSTDDLIKKLKLNRKTFYKIYNSHPEIHQNIRKISANCKRIKDLIDENPNQLTYADLASKTDTSMIVVKNSVKRLDYEDKIIIVPTISSQVRELLENNPCKYDINEIAELVSSNYNTVYKVIQRSKQMHLLA